MSRLPAALAPCCAFLVLVLAGCAVGPAGPELADGGGALPVAGQQGDESAGLARMADTALRTGEAATAAGLFEQVLARDGRNLPAAVGLGTALLSLARPQDAGRAFERALSIDRNAPAARYGYARAMLALRRPELAVEHLEAALRRRPDDVQALNALGVAHDLLGRQDLAIATYRRGLAVAPGTVALRNNLGLSLALAGRFDEALDHLRPLGDGPGASRRTRQNLALVHALGGDLAAAQRLGRADLSESELEANLAYVAAVRGFRDTGSRAAAVRPVLPADGGRRVPRALAAVPGDGTASLPEPAAGQEEDAVNRETGAGFGQPLAAPAASEESQVAAAPRRMVPAGPALSPFFN